MLNVRETVHAWLYGDRGTSGKNRYTDKQRPSKISVWRDYPFEPERHQNHMHAGTMAKYGDYQVYYCYTCSTHYRAAQGTQPGWSTPWD